MYISVVIFTGLRLTSNSLCLATSLEAWTLTPCRQRGLLCNKQIERIRAPVALESLWAKNGAPHYPRASFLPSPPPCSGSSQSRRAGNVVNSQLGLRRNSAEIEFRAFGYQIWRVERTIFVTFFAINIY